MLQSRRGFLIGAGVVLTTAFVKDARSFIDRTSQPLLATPSQVVETMYWHDIPDEGYQLTLGPGALRRLRPRGENFLSGKASSTEPTMRSRRSVPLIALNRGISTSLSKRAFGRIGSTSQVVRSPGLTTCSKKSISALSAIPGADRCSSLTWGRTPATILITSMRRTSCRCPCPYYRRG
jgi:hypothetical protein